MNFSCHFTLKTIVSPTHCWDVIIRLNTTILNVNAMVCKEFHQSFKHLLSINCVFDLARTSQIAQLVYHAPSIWRSELIDQHDLHQLWNRDKLTSLTRERVSFRTWLAISLACSSQWYDHYHDLRDSGCVAWGHHNPPKAVAFPYIFSYERIRSELGLVHMQN
jgi:hypothetical protein